MFDCRQDSDALWNQFNVKLTGVLDLQLLEVMYRRETDPKAATSTGQFSTRNKRQRSQRRSQKTDEVERIYGFRRCIELYVKDGDLIKIKEKGKKLVQDDEKV